MDANHNIRITDFGFGNTFHRDRLLDTYCGSPFYAAPEMIRGIQYIGPEVDVWSLGVIMFALLSGKLPFDAATMSELYEKIAKGKYVCPSHFSPEAVHLISRMLVVDPKRRATVSEIRSHPWVNAGYNEYISSFLAHRPRTVALPNPESIAELESYGFRREDSARVLRTEVNPHPIVSLYHLIDEARQRKEEQMFRMCTNGDLIDFGTDNNNNDVLLGTKIPTLVNTARQPQPQQQRSSSTSSPAPTMMTRRRSIQQHQPQQQQPQQEQQSSTGTTQIRGLFTIHASSEKPLPYIYEEIERALRVHQIRWHRQSDSAYLCDDMAGGYQFRIDIIRRLGQQGTVHDLQVSRVGGSFWNQRSIASRILREMRL